MKVAYLFSRYPVPSQTFCDTEMRALEAAGAEVEIFSCSPPPTAFRHGAADRPAAPVFYAPPKSALELWAASAQTRGEWPAALVAGHLERFGKRFDPAGRARQALYFCDLARRRGIGRVHVHFANHATHVAALMAALGGPAFSFTAHAQDFLVDLGSDALLAEFCERAEFIVAVSDWSRRALAAKAPGAAAKIHRVYNGLPSDRWPDPAPPPADSGTTLRIFSAGRLIPFKGFGDLIEACARLRTDGVPVRCEIAGDGPLRVELENRLAALGLSGAVRLPGLLTQEEIRARLAACDVFALACREDEATGACDVLPTVILEAMAAARPVVSTALAGVPEMVEDGRTGRLVAPGDASALASALTELAADPARRAAFGQAGREKWRAQFTAEEAADRLLALFGAAPHSTLPPTAPEPGTLCLLPQWPPARGDGLLFPWHEACAGRPGLRLVALDCPAKLPQEDRARQAAGVEAIEYLPDAMALEAEWRDCARQAHAVEVWRRELGGAVDSWQFLQEARRALWLRNRLARFGQRPRRILAVGGGSLLCGYLLARLGVVGAEGASFLVAAPADGGPPGSTLRRLAPGFAGGGWIIGGRKLAAELGPAFACGDLAAALAAFRL